MIKRWIEENILIPLEEIINKTDSLRETVSVQIKYLSDSKDLIVEEKDREIANLKIQLAKLEENNRTLQKQIEGFCDVEKKISKIDDYFIESINTVIDSSQQKANKWIQDKNKTLNDLCEVLSKQNDFLKNKNDVLSEICDGLARDGNAIKDTLTDKENECAELIECINTLCNGAYNADFVEFFALKTYRGWKYLCCDGISTIDFDDIDGIEVCWKSGEKVKVIYNKKG